MYTDLIFSNINKHIFLNVEEKMHFQSFLEEESLERKSFVVKQNGPCKYIYFINNGIFRAYHMSAEGKESTIMFGQQDWWITDMNSFINQMPAMVNVQAIEKSTVLKLSKENLDKLYIKIPQFNLFFRILFQNAYCREQTRMIQNLSMLAKDRYDQFNQKYPQIAEKVTLKQIASYLGITPEFLSAIRSKKG